MLSFFRVAVPLAAAISQLLYITSATRKAQILTPALYALSTCLPPAVLSLFPAFFLSMLLFFQTLTLPSLRQSPTIILTARL